MRKQINNLINILMGSFFGVFIGQTLYTYWHYQKYPDLYASYSAPWYASIIVRGIPLIIFLLVCLLIKMILKKKMSAQ